MKNYFVAMIVMLSLLFGSSYSQAQSFEAKNFNIDVGYVFGSRAYSANFLSPGVVVSLEKGVHKWIGAGAYVGVQHQVIGVPISASNNIGYTAVYTGITGSFHFYQMIQDLVGKDIKADQLDIAIKHSFGARLTFPSNGSVALSPNFSVSANVRYFFTDFFGVYVEAGYPAAGIAIAGIAFKF